MPVATITTPPITVPPYVSGWPQYPATFPIPNRQPYGYGVDMGVVRSDFAAGNARQRRAFRTMPTALALSFSMRIEDLYTWQNWVNANAFDWFACPVSTMFAGSPPTPGNTRFELLRFTSDLSVQMEGFNWVAIQVAAELAPDAQAANPGWGAGGWIVGGTPASPSPDWVIGGSPVGPSTGAIIAGSPAIPATF
jgi:hypothetical protein